MLVQIDARCGRQRQASALGALTLLSCRPSAAGCFVLRLHMPTKPTAWSLHSHMHCPGCRPKHVRSSMHGRCSLQANWHEQVLVQICSSSSQTEVHDHQTWIDIMPVEHPPGGSRRPPHPCSCQQSCQRPGWTCQSGTGHHSTCAGTGARVKPLTFNMNSQ
jgi:hypothetical protein